MLTQSEQVLKYISGLEIDGKEYHKEKYRKMLASSALIS